MANSGSCVDLVLFSFSPQGVVLLVIKYLMQFATVLLGIYGLYAFKKSGKNKWLNRSFYCTVITLVASYVVALIYTLFEPLYGFADTDESIFDRNIINTETIVEDINTKCDINLEILVETTFSILFCFLGLQMSFLLTTYALRLVIQFDNTPFAVTKINYYILVILITTFLLLALIVSITLVIDFDIANIVSAFAYVLYLISMLYVCAIYVKKMSLMAQSNLITLKDIDAMNENGNNLNNLNDDNGEAAGVPVVQMKSISSVDVIDWHGSGNRSLGSTQGVVGLSDVQESSHGVSGGHDQEKTKKQRAPDHKMQFEYLFNQLTLYCVSILTVKLYMSKKMSLRTSVFCAAAYTYTRMLYIYVFHIGILDRCCYNNFC